MSWRRGWLVIVKAIVVGATATSITSTSALAGGLPDGFVYLRDVDPTILQDMRYATPHNFTGARVPGYQSDECVLARPVAKALVRVQRNLLGQSLSLKMYDCYRPDRAVKAFLRWANNGRNTTATMAYHPGLTKPQIVARGYIAPRSTHSTGRAVDLTVVQLPPLSGTGGRNIVETSCIDLVERRRPDTSVDMGTDYDCFHRRSHTWNKAVGQRALAWRRMLVEAMHAEGFRNFSKEWWHFNFRTEGFDARRDFVVPNRDARQVDPRDGTESGDAAVLE